MEHAFTLPLAYEGQELELEAKWVKLGYLSRFHIYIEGQELVFEQDDERKYRVLNPSPESPLPINRALVEAVIKVLEELTA